MITTEAITETAGVGSFGQANINNNSILGVGATAIPWFDQEVTWYGEYGNNKGTQIYAPTTRTPEPLDTALFEATRCYPFKMSLMERVNALSTPQKVMRISGEYTLDFNVKPNSLYRALNKYSVVSAMRGAVQMISYEMSLGLCLISAVVLTGTMQVSGIVEAQTGAWNWLIIKGHVPAILAFLVFLVAGNAEANRGPFDLAEAESELTAGYHTEYSGMGFGFYYLAEYLNLFVISGIASTVFLGGWAPLNIGIEGFDNLMNLIPGFIWFFGKTFAVVWLLMWVRWTFPRLRIDQILKLEWKYLMPLSLVILILMTVCVAFGFHG
jgi:hypothetical protein